MAKTVFLIIGMCVILIIDQRSHSMIFLVTFITAWTPYAVVSFLSFISPNLISPLGGTLPGKTLMKMDQLLYLS